MLGCLWIVLKVHSQVWDNFWELKLFKNDKKSFFISLKSSFHSQDIYIFILTFWSCRKNDLIRKEFNFKIYFTTWLTSNCNVLPNISRSKANPIRQQQFDQLIEYNMRNVLVEKSYTKCSGKTINRHFPKKSKLSISLDHY